MIKKPIRLADIARVARVHETTVSLALRDSANIAESTRQKIKAIANNLGYQANPAFQALAKYSKGADFQNPQVLYVTDRSLHGTERSGFSQEPYYRGALRCLSRAGFRLDHSISPTAMGLHQKLEDRRVAGILLGAVDERSPFLDVLAPEKTLMVKIGGAIAGIRMPVVLEDTLGVMRLAMLGAKEHGAKRIGFILPSSYDEFAGRDWHMAFLRSQVEADGFNSLPILHLYSRGNEIPWRQDDRRAKDLGQLRTWINRYRPDCVIGFTEQSQLDITELGLSIPEDLSYINLLAQVGCPRSAGLQDHREFVGEIAAEILVRAIRQHQEPPLFGTKTVVESHWQEGASLPAKRRERSDGNDGVVGPGTVSLTELFPV